MTRCPECFARPDMAHRTLGRCPGIPETPRQARRVGTQRGYVPPSRANRQPRDEWLDAVRSTPEQKRALANERQRRYRQRQAAA